MQIADWSEADCIIKDWLSNGADYIIEDWPSNNYAIMQNYKFDAQR